MTLEKSNSAHRGIPYCQERHRLTEAVLAAFHEFAALHSQQTQAIIEGDRDFARFDDLIHMARASKDEAKYALMAHIEAHRC